MKVIPAGIELHQLSYKVPGSGMLLGLQEQIVLRQGFPDLYIRNQGIDFSQVWFSRIVLGQL